MILNQRLLDDCSNSTRINFAFHALLGIIAQTGLFIGFSFMHCYVPICTINLKFVANLLQNCFFVAKSVNPLSGLFPRKSLNSLIDSPLTLFSLLLLLLRKYPLLYWYPHVPLLPEWLLRWFRSHKIWYRRYVWRCGMKRTVT